jgi:hypothetical protein
MISLRDVAPRDFAHRVALRIFAVQEREGRSARGEQVHRTVQQGAQGPLTFFWNGNGPSGAALPRGRYIAELAALDANDAPLQSVELPFVHDTAEAQYAARGEVEGQLQVAGEGALGNTRVELVDRQGNVVQSAETTSSGQYRFRNVDNGDYQVRVQRSGFRPAAMRVNAAPGRSSGASMHMQRE